VANILLGVYYLYESSRHATNDPAFGSLYKLAMTQYTQKAFKLDKEYPMTCAMFGGYFLLRKHFPTVEALARKAIELTDVNAIASDGWYLLARKEHYEGDPTRASDYYSKSDQARGGADKGYLPAKFGAVQMQVKMKDYNGAKFRLEKITQVAKNPESMSLLGALYAEEVFAAQASGSKEDKSTEIKKATSLLESVRSLWKDEKKKLSPDESVLLYLARLYESNFPDKSMQCLQQVEQMQLSQIPEEDRPGDIEDEEAKMNLLRENLSPQLLSNMGCFLYQSEKIEQARSMFQTALNACVKSRDKDEGTDTDALVTTISYNLARTYEAAGMPDEAKKVYEGLLERHSDYTEANARLTYISLRQSPTDEGPRKMAKLYETESANLEVRALFGWYLSKSKRRVANIAEDHEQRHYKHTLQGHDKHDRYSLTGMGNIYLLTARDMRRDTDQEKEKRRKMYEKAVEFFDKALQLDPKNAYAAQGIAIALVDDKKDYSSAVQIFSRIRDTLRDASVYLNLGHVYAELRQFSKSIENVSLLCHDSSLEFAD
jgi:RNA polymerase-associated protein CTR9